MPNSVSQTEPSVRRPPPGPQTSAKGKRKGQSNTVFSNLDGQGRAGRGSRGPGRGERLRKGRPPGGSFSWQLDVHKAPGGSKGLLEEGYVLTTSGELRPGTYRCWTVHKVTPVANLNRILALPRTSQPTFPIYSMRKPRLREAHPLVPKPLNLLTTASCLLISEGN